MKPLLRHRADRRSLAFVVVHFAMVAGAWQTYGLNPYLALAWLPFIAISAFAGTTAAHNALHTPVFTHRGLNRAWQIVVSLTFGYAASAYVPAHNLGHHKHLQTPRDVLRTDQVRYRSNLVNVLAYTGRAAWHMFSVDVHYIVKMRSARPRWYNQLLLELFAVALLFGGFLRLDPVAALVCVIVPYMLGLRFVVGLGYLQHDGCDAESPYDHSRNFVGGLFNWVAFNNGYHTIHHEKPGLHWSLAPAAHSERVAAHIHPNLDQTSMLTYVWRTFGWPARRVRFDGEAIQFEEPTVNEVWAPTPASMPTGVSLGAADAP